MIVQFQSKSSRSSEYNCGAEDRLDQKVNPRQHSIGSSLRVKPIEEHVPSCDTLSTNACSTSVMHSECKFNFARAAQLSVQLSVDFKSARLRAR